MKIDVEEEREARVPEWVAIAEVPALSVRVYTLLRGKMTDGRRADLATKCRVSARTIDAALSALQQIGAIEIVETPGRPHGYIVRSTPSQIERSPSQPVARVSRRSNERVREDQDQLHLVSNSENVPLQLARTLAARVADNTDRAVREPSSRDITAIDRLLRLDGAAAADVERVIEWATRDDFWASNVLSATSLRKHFPRLLIQLSGRAGDRRRRDLAAQKEEAERERRRREREQQDGVPMTAEAKAAWQKMRSRKGVDREQRSS